VAYGRLVFSELSSGGIRLDNCDNCDNVIHIRRAQRARLAAEVHEQLPGLGDGERRQVLEDRLREQAAAEAEDFVWRREQAAVEQARRDAARAAARSGRSVNARPRRLPTLSGRRCRARTAARSRRPGCARRAATGARPRP
jgi:hypothetical protein